MAADSTPKVIFHLGMLDLDAIPSLGNGYREFRQGGKSSTSTALSTMGTLSDHISCTPSVQHPQQVRFSRSKLSAAFACSSPAVDGRLLDFSMYCVAEEESLGDGYDGQFVRSKGDPQIESSRVARPPNNEDGTVDDQTAKLL